MIYMIESVNTQRFIENFISTNKMKMSLILRKTTILKYQQAYYVPTPNWWEA